MRILLTFLLVLVAIVTLLLGAYDLLTNAASSALVMLGVGLLCIVFAFFAFRRRRSA